MKLNFLQSVCGALFAAIAITAPMSESLAQAKRIPIEDFTRRAKLTSPQFNFDGTKLAALEEFKDRRNIVVIDLVNNKIHRTTALTDFDVGNFSWINNTRLLFGLYDAQVGLTEQRGGGLFATNFDGTEGITLSSNFDGCSQKGSTCRPLGVQKRIKNSDDIIAWGYERDMRSQDLYLLNTRTGAKKLITTDNPGNVQKYVVDYEGNPRAAVITTNRATGESAFLYKDSPTSPWRKIGTYGTFDRAIDPLSFDSKGELYVSSNLETDKAALYVFDPKTGGLGEKVVAHKDVDIGMGNGGGLILNRDSWVIEGVYINADKPEVIWVDKELAALQRSIDATLGVDRTNSLRRIKPGLYSVRSYSGSDPGTMYLFDSQKGSLKELFSERNWIKPEQMGKTRSVRYKARDGLEIQGYLTIPAGSDGKNLPLIAWIHGGPWARDTWDWDVDAQFLASRGYAVFQPNYRGSQGFGLKHLESGYKKLGQEMQDDITDGINHLVAQGIVNKDKVCIGGGSYGGYATMMGLVKNNDLYKCGINIVGVVNLFYWIELGYTDFNSINAKGSTYFLTRAVGDPSSDREMMTKYSPVFHTDKINAPVLIIHGADDFRVPIKHAEDLRREMDRNKKPYEWLVFKGEGHGFLKTENRTEMYERIEKFLDKHMPSGR